MSETIVTFFVAGKPASQPRGKGVRKGAFVRVVSNNTDHIVSWKESIRQEALVAMTGRQRAEDIALRVELVFQFLRTGKLKKPKHRERFALVTTGKDVDNLAKAVLDTMNGIVWDDDRRVSTLLVRKQYCMPNQRPGVQIGVFIDEPEQLPFYP